VISIRTAVLPVVAIAVLAVLVLSSGLSPVAEGRLVPAGGVSAPLRTASLSVTNITVGKNPLSMAYDPSNKMVYVANTASNTTSAIKSATSTPVTIKVGHDPNELSYDPTDKDIYVLNDLSGTVSVINGTNKVTHTLTVPGSFGSFLTVDPANGNVYTFSYNGSVPTLSDLNHTTWKVKNIAVASRLDSMVFDNATNDLVVSEPALNELQIIAPNNAVSKVLLTKGLTPAYLTYDPADKDVFVTDIGENAMGVTKTGNVSVLGTGNTIVKTIQVAPAPIVASYDPADRNMFVVSLTNLPVPTKNGTVTVLTANLTVAKTVPVGKFCEFPSYDPTNHDMYLPCTRSNQTYVINSTTFKVAVKLATTGNPVVAFYDPGISEMLVANDPVLYNRTSTVKNLAFVVPASNSGMMKLTLGIGGLGDGIYDPTDFGVWVSNTGSGTVSVIL
jgi:YVTN family beta-propeller protein